MDNQLEDLICLAEKVSASTNQESRIYMSLKVLYETYKMPKDIPIINGVVTWNGLKIHIIPVASDNCIVESDTVFVIPYDENTESLKIVFEN